MISKLFKTGAVVSGLLALCLSGASVQAARAAEKRFDGVTLVVGTFGGSWKDRINEYIGPKFAELGGTLQFVEGNPRALLARLIAARGQAAPMDVFETTDSLWPLITKAGLARKLDTAEIPNTRHLDPRMYDEYRVADWITEEGFLYNPDKFRELGLPEPTRFSDLLNPKLRGKVSIPDITVNTVLNPLVGFAADRGGDESHIEPGLEAVHDLDVFAFWHSITQFTQMYQAGDIWAGVCHAGYGVRLSDAGLKVAFVHPKVKDRRGMASRGFAVIAANSENVEAAEWYINMLVSKEMQTILHVKNGIVPTNMLVQEEQAGQQKLDALGHPFLLISAKDIENLYYTDWDKVDLQEWTRKWNEIVLK